VPIVSRSKGQRQQRPKKRSPPYTTDEKINEMSGFGDRTSTHAA
jgi:hypothetical protein